MAEKDVAEEENAPGIPSITHLTYFSYSKGILLKDITSLVRLSAAIGSPGHALELP